jgi:hypothetical protein
VVQEPVTQTPPAAAVPTPEVIAAPAAVDTAPVPAPSDTIKPEQPPTTATTTTPSAAPGPSVATPAAAPAAAPQAQTGKRVVRREGLVRSTKSIQAPTYEELISVETRKTINFIHAANEQVNLRHFKGQKVVVTGEEGIDSRWPKTPVIKVETIAIAD